MSITAGNMSFWKHVLCSAIEAFSLRSPSFDHTLLRVSCQKGGDSGCRKVVLEDEKIRNPGKKRDYLGDFWMG